MGEAVGGEAVDDAEGVAEIVVEARPDDAGRQRVADVADALADVIPDVGNFSGGRAALQVDEDRRDAGAREAAQEVELRRLLQLALEPLGDLLERVLDGRARPGGLHHHRLDDEGRVFAAAEPEIGARRRRAPPRSSDRRRASGCLSAHSERLKPISRLRSEQADLLTRVQRLHARGDDDLAGVEALPIRRPWPGRSAARRHCACDTVCFAGSTIQTAGCWLNCVSAVAGISMTATGVDLHAAGHGGAEPHRRRRIGQADLDLEGAGHRVGLRRNLAHAPVRGDRRIVGQADGDLRIARRRADELRRARRRPRRGRPCARASTIICPACTTSPAPGPIAVTTPGASALSSVKLTRSWAVFSCASAASTCDCGGLLRLLGLVVVRARGPALLEQRVLALEMVARLRQLALGGGEIGLRGAQRVELVLRLQACDHLPGLDPVAELDGRSRAPAGDAERER